MGAARMYVCMYVCMYRDGLASGPRVESSRVESSQVEDSIQIKSIHQRTTFLLGSTALIGCVSVCSL